LTTLEWLLIVAAVAGLAALAVVLVQNVVDDTAEQIAGSSARITAAQVAAEAINNDDDKDDNKRSACNRLSITYSDAFAEDPERRSLWTDGDTRSDKGEGVCGIVTETVATAVTSATDSTSCAAVVSTYAPALRGGKMFTWNTDLNGDGTAGPNGCVML